jgi:lysophospholipase L1-like esterase
MHNMIRRLYRRSRIVGASLTTATPGPGESAGMVGGRRSAGVVRGSQMALGACLVAVLLATISSTASAAPTYASSMDALGGSFTRGFNTDCPNAWIDCPQNSWATGTNPVVDSIYLRLLALNPRLRDNNANDAQSRSTMADLDAQAQSAVRRDAELVTIATGTNDACGGHTGEMTEVSVFSDEFTQAMDTLTTGLPHARVHVLSIPDIYQRWETFHIIPSAVKAWRSIPFCPTLLTHPTSNAPADVQRRAAVRARVLDFNAVLAQVCAQYPQCTTDAGAAFRAPVTAAEFSTHDYWHPNITGQAALAKRIWDTLGY